MAHPVAQANPLECLAGLFPSLLTSNPGVDQRELDVVQAGGPRQQVESLEHEADLLVPDPGQLVVLQLRYPVAIEPVLPTCGTVETADQVHQRRFARPRRSHDCHELVLADGHVHAAERANDLASHVILALEIAGDDDRVPGDIGREHGHPLFGIQYGTGHSLRPISASICALARR
jgi:hypothetical protein